jgi:hypothetical protein
MSIAFVKPHHQSHHKAHHRSLHAVDRRASRARRVRRAREELVHHARNRCGRTARDGRVLAECLLALTLLAVAATALSSGTRAVATLADDAVLVARAHAVTQSAAERALAAPCAQTPDRTATVAAGPRIVAQQRTEREASALVRVVTAQLAPSPYAQRETQRLALSVARPCD